MDSKQAGDARSRLAAMMRGEKVGIDNLTLTRMVDMIIVKTPKISFAGSGARNLSCVYEDHYHITVRLTEEVVKYDVLDSLDIEYTVMLRVPNSGDNEKDIDAIHSALQKAITSKRKKNRAALAPYVASLPE